MRALLTGIASAASSRQAVAGSAGVGKTTLVQQVKAEALRAGYWSTDALVPIYPGDTTDAPIVRILGAMYETVLAMLGPRLEYEEAGREAKQLVRTFRVASGGLTLGHPVVGTVGGTRGEQVVTPPGVGLLEGPRLIRRLLTLAEIEGARGVLLHLDNLEHLTDADERAAAQTLRGLRDPLFLQSGLHTIAVGTTDAVHGVLMSTPQMRSVWATPMILAPLTAAQLDALLAARYHYLVHDESRPVVPPIAPDAVAILYTLYQGDLRGTLRALDEGAQLLLGYGAAGGTAPLTYPELASVLGQRYRTELTTSLDERRLGKFEALTATGGKAWTQAELGGIWQLSQSRVSRLARDLVARGYLVVLPRVTGEPGRYALSGTSRIIFQGADRPRVQQAF
ncbi:MAG: AAA family ATPase [Gemmatimonadales bacterium]|nr:AAA family ATPase [Gemmatimonadales bacterium]